MNIINKRSLILLLIMFFFNSYSVYATNEPDLAASACLSYASQGHFNGALCRYYSASSCGGSNARIVYQHNTHTSCYQLYQSWLIQSSGCPNGGSYNVTNGSTVTSPNICTNPVPSCDTVGFNPDAFYPSGYCVYYDGVPGTAPDSQCQGGEAIHDIPSCKLAPCPDGSYVDTSLGQSCSVPKQCWDGSIVYGEASCPAPPYICPDGSQVTNQEQCPQTSTDNKLCSDGSVIPLDVDCPSVTTAHCLDGSIVANISQCPDQSSAGHYQCSDGSIAQSSNNCPLLQTSSSNLQDTLQTSITGTTPEGPVNLTITNDLQLDALNSRLDSIRNAIKNQDIEGLKQSINDLNIDGIIDAINNKELELDTTNLENLLTQIREINQNSDDKLNDLKQLFEHDSEINPEENEDNEETTLLSFIDQLSANFDTQTDLLSDYITGLGLDNPFSNIQFLDKQFWLPSFPQHQSCSGSINLSIFGRQIEFDPCLKLAPLREVLAWVFYVLFFIRIFNMMFTIHEVN